MSFAGVTFLLAGRFVVVLGSFFRILENFKEILILLSCLSLLFGKFRRTGESFVLFSSDWTRCVCGIEEVDSDRYVTKRTRIGRMLVCMLMVT